MSLPVAAALVVASGSTLVKVPFLRDPATMRLVLLAPVLLVLALAPALASPAPELESVHIRASRRGRALITVILAGAGAAAAAAILAVLGEPATAVEVARNACYLGAVQLLVFAFVAADLAWVGPVTLVALTYAVGVDPETREGRGWAFLLAPAGGLGVAVAVLAFGSGAWAFVVRRPR